MVDDREMAPVGRAKMESMALCNHSLKGSMAFRNGIIHSNERGSKFQCIGAKMEKRRNRDIIEVNRQ